MMPRKRMGRHDDREEMWKKEKDELGVEMVLSLYCCIFLLGKKKG